MYTLASSHTERLLPIHVQMYTARPSLQAGNGGIFAFLCRPSFLPRITLTLYCAVPMR